MLLEKIKRRVFDLDDWLFEKTSGLDLGGIVPHAALISEHTDRCDFSRDRLLRRMVSELAGAFG